jgi:hypothetical protein
MATKEAVGKKKRPNKSASRKKNARNSKPAARRARKHAVVEAVMGVDAPAPVPPPHKKADKSDAYDIGGESGES